MCPAVLPRSCSAMFVPLAATLMAVAVTEKAAAVLITTADGVYGADNQIMGFGNGRELVNKGLSSTIELRNNGFSGNNFVGALRFDLSTMTQPAGAATLSVTPASDVSVDTQLVVYALNEGAFLASGVEPENSGAAELSEIAYTEGDDNFANGSGSELIGDNAPGFVETFTSVSAVSDAFRPTSTLIESVAIANGTPSGTVLSTSASALVDALNADTNDAIVLYLFNTNPAQSFLLHTADFSLGNAPTLDITPIPEPSSFAVIVSLLAMRFTWATRR